MRKLIWICQTAIRFSSRSDSSLAQMNNRSSEYKKIVPNIFLHFISSFALESTTRRLCVRSLDRLWNVFDNWPRAVTNKNAILICQPFKVTPRMRLEWLCNRAVPYVIGLTKKNLSCMNHDNCTSPINQSFNCFISSSRESGRSTWNETAQRCHPVASHKFLLNWKWFTSALHEEKSRTSKLGAFSLERSRRCGGEERQRRTWWCRAWHVNKKSVFIL